MVQCLQCYAFLQAVTAPMSSLNAIAVEAYKKYILVSLIQNGQVCSPLPALRPLLL